MGGKWRLSVPTKTRIEVLFFKTHPEGHRTRFRSISHPRSLTIFYGTKTRNRENLSAEKRYAETSTWYRTQHLKLGKPLPPVWLCGPLDCSLLGSVCGILQARILERVAVPFWHLPDAGIELGISEFQVDFFFTSWTTREALKDIYFILFIWLHGVFIEVCRIFDLCCCIWDLVPRPGIKPGPPPLGAWSFSHWAREVPFLSHVQLFVTSWTVAPKTPLSMGLLQAIALKGRIWNQ